MRTMVEEEVREVAGPPVDTEITLGMKSLLGVFFGSVLICGVFFGFGYSLGRGYTHGSASSSVAAPAIAVKSAAPTGAASAATSSAQSDSSDSNPQTVVSDSQSGASSSGASSDAAQGELASRAASQSAAAPQASQQYEYVATPDGPARRPASASERNPGRAAAASATLATVPAPAISKPSAAVVHQEPALVEAPVTQPRPQPLLASVTRTPMPAAASAIPLASSTTAGGTMVQIAAVSHQEDASILVAALRRRGYEVLVRNEPTDALFHVQIGPFNSRDQAKAMRARLLTDGYNAILK